AGVDARAYRDRLYHKLSFLDYVPVSFISAATGHGLKKMLEIASHVVGAYRRKIQTSAVNQALQRIVRAHAAPLTQGKPVKFYYGTQTGTCPPAFTLFVNTPRAVPEGYQRYLTHQLRENLGLEYAPIRLILRPRREEKRQRPREESCPLEALECIAPFLNEFPKHPRSLPLLQHLIYLRPVSTALWRYFSHQRS